MQSNTYHLFKQEPFVENFDKNTKLENIFSAVQQAEVISFDIFDTLLINIAEQRREEKRREFRF